jgi:predicted RNase H-like nuclease (RuvC/YqgF family)
LAPEASQTMRVTAVLSAIAAPCENTDCVSPNGRSTLRRMSEEHAETTVDLAYIGRALQRLTAEVASLRDDMQVMAAIVSRLDNSHARLLDEIRATHAQVDRLATRVRAHDERIDVLEDKAR